MEPAQTTNIVDVYINYLRRKLDDPAPGRIIRTVRGQGYMAPLQPESSLATLHAAALDVASLPSAIDGIDALESRDAAP
jgi:DNA-binding winged helix-turn-helix (wHTH) protein